MDKEMSLQKRWVAFGPTGAVGSIQQEDDGFSVRMIGDVEQRGVYPTMDAAKGAVHQFMPPGSERPEFREH